ncbi:carbohydrate ABC transporter permease [Streptomyces sp. RKAG293]|uniref:carbohydrate ABC transporter permease n=1 Tax=Streptomyces sp. RKAG293 TaxID=2893403 RepID=UPI002033F227|nr:carbohydrate ABC transporter permease [Streptomyces sp. RKAG293]MCM2422785.1 carbohydrate ABC transporter permease [Streptomyces sp. RKAG293]
MVLPFAGRSTKQAPDCAGPRARRRPSGWHLLLAPLSVLFLLPLAQMLITSFTDNGEINRYPPRFLPSALHIAGYTRLFTDAPVARWIMNSMIVSGIAVVSHLVLCSLGGYAYARLSFRGRTVGFVALLSTIMIPTQMLMIPTYFMFSRLGLIDTLAAAFVPFLTSAFGVFLMRQFFLSVPKELEEAGRMDGLSTVGVLIRIVLPLARPALTTLAIFTLLNSWNDLLWPLIAINDPQLYTIQLGLLNFQGAHHIDWQELMACNVVASAPLILGFVFAQKQFVQTMSLSGVKG